MIISQIKWSPTESFEILGFPFYIYSLMFILAFLVGYNLVKSFFAKENVDEKYLDLTTTVEPEFDLWKWVDFWQPVDEIIFFKREVYEQALKQLELHLI